MLFNPGASAAYHLPDRREVTPASISGSAMSLPNEPGFRLGREGTPKRAPVRKLARGARFRELYAMLGLRAAAHADGTLEITVGVTSEATKGVSRATDQADDTPSLRGHDEPLRRPRERHLDKEALRVARYPGRGRGRRSR